MLAHVGIDFVEKIILICSLKIGKLKDYQSKDFRACSVFWFDGENELKFAPIRHKKQSVFPISSGDRSALHEHFCNEIGVNFGHL